MIVPDFFKNCNGKSCAGLTEGSRANDVRPYGMPFQNGQTDSSALTGISSIRGDFLFGSSTEELASHRLD